MYLLLNAQQLTQVQIYSPPLLRDSVVNFSSLQEAMHVGILFPGFWSVDVLVWRVFSEKDIQIHG